MAQKNIYLLHAKIIFNEAALKWISSWPIKDRFRTSFWFQGSLQTVPSEIVSGGDIDKIGQTYEVTILVHKADFLYGKLSSGITFQFGIISYPIGEGIIITVD